MGNYLKDSIKPSRAIDASPYTLEQLQGLQREARLTIDRAMRFDKKMDWTNKALDESQRLWHLSDVAFDDYDKAMKEVLKFVHLNSTTY